MGQLLSEVGQEVVGRGLLHSLLLMTGIGCFDRVVIDDTDSL
jgi:hypothetical protein